MLGGHRGPNVVEAYVKGIRAFAGDGVYAAMRR